jgi:hypothetical protein
MIKVSAPIESVAYTQHCPVIYLRSSFISWFRENIQYARHGELYVCRYNEWHAEGHILGSSHIHIEFGFIVEEEAILFKMVWG